jgi:hypothetical protein
MSEIPQDIRDTFARWFADARPGTPEPGDADVLYVLVKMDGRAEPLPFAQLWPREFPYTEDTARELVRNSLTKGKPSIVPWFRIVSIVREPYLIEVD